MGRISHPNVGKKDMKKGASKPLFKVVLSEYLFQILFRCCSRADTVIFHKEIQHTG